MGPRPGGARWWGYVGRWGDNRRGTRRSVGRAESRAVDKTDPLVGCVPVCSPVNGEGGRIGECNLKNDSIGII